MSKILVTTAPFGKTSIMPKALLQEHEVVYNDLERKHTQEEVVALMKAIKPEYIIAGTEVYDKEVLYACHELKMISRVGIGVDGIDFDECKKRNIVVSNTPDAPSNAVAELTILQMLNMLRKVQNVSEDLLHREKWNRYIGRELRDCKVGIIGCGRIGMLVLQKLSCMVSGVVFVNDIDESAIKKCPIGWIAQETKETILGTCDIISIHIPLNDVKVCNKDYITAKDLAMVKADARILNMSRGGIINERDLYNWLKENKKACAAVDTFENEVYRGELLKLHNAYLTPHLGSCTVTSRNAMETGAVRNVLDHICGKEIKDRII